jgi:hypothetical protein
MEALANGRDGFGTVGIVDVLHLVHNEVAGSVRIRPPER